MNEFINKRVFVIPGVDDVREELEKQNFQWVDYVVCVMFMVPSLLVGIYFAFFSGVTPEKFLVGDRKLNVFPVAFSLTASFITGTIILDVPTETYLYGMQHFYSIIGRVIMTVLMTTFFLPIFYRLESISIYEYLERRFNKNVRILGALLFIIGMITLLPPYMQIPIQTFRQLPSIDEKYMIPILCSICIFSTSLGGIKSVIYTDTIHIFLITAALLLIAIKGTLDLDLNFVLESNLKSTRIEWPNLDLNSSSKYTFWSSTIGGCFFFLFIMGTNQSIQQKYGCLSTLKSSRRVAWIFLAFSSFFLVLLTFCGILMYAAFDQCDPLKTKLSEDKYQLLPLLVIKILGNQTGFPGIFVAGIWCVCLSSWMTPLHAVTTVIMEDLYSFFRTTQLKEGAQVIFLKLTTTIFGLSCLGLIFIMDDMGLTLQISEKTTLIASGPLLGLFLAGMFLPWVSSKGAFIGTISSLIFMTWINLHSTTDNISFSTKPLTTEECRYHFLPPHANSSVILSPKEFEFFNISSSWYTFIGSAIVIIISLPIGLISGSDPRDVDPTLLAPFLKKFIKPREFPNEPGDGIIYAFYLPKQVDNNVVFQET